MGVLKDGTYVSSALVFETKDWRALHEYSSFARLSACDRALTTYISTMLATHAELLA